MAPGFQVRTEVLLFFAVVAFAVLVGLAGSVWLLARRKQASCKLDRALVLWWSGVVCAIYLYIGLWLTAEGFWFDYGGPPLMFVAFVFFGLFLFLPALMCEFWVPKFGANMMIFVAIIGGLGLLSIPVPDPDMFSEYEWWMKTLGFGVLLPYWIASFAILLTATKSRKFTLRELIWAVTLAAIALGTCGAVIRKATPYQVPALVDESSLTSQVFDVRRRTETKNYTKARTNDESWHPNVCQARFCDSRWNVRDCRIFAILKEAIISDSNSCKSVMISSDASQSVEPLFSEPSAAFVGIFACGPDSVADGKVLSLSGLFLR